MARVALTRQWHHPFQPLYRPRLFRHQQQVSLVGALERAENQEKEAEKVVVKVEKAAAKVEKAARGTTAIRTPTLPLVEPMMVLEID